MPPPAFTALDTFVILLVGAISAYTRLWTISFPEDVCFDEVHFGNFTSWYIRKEFHFDIHPPLGKMMMASIAGLSGYKGDIKRFSALGQTYEMGESVYVMIRMIPAIFSSMCPPLIYCSARLLDIGVLPSFFTALMLALESSMIVEAKFILSDGLLHFWSAVHYFTFCLFMRYQCDSLAILAGVTLGCAASCKFTALGLVAVDGITQIIWILRTWPSIADIIVRGVCFLLPTVIVVFLSWCWHFIANPYAGYHSHYISKQDAHTLIDMKKVNTTYWGNRVRKSPLLERMVNWNVVMNRVNMRSKIPHPWESKPENWPFLTDKPVLFYSRKDRRISCFGMPAVYWVSTASLFLIVPVFIYRRKISWQCLLFAWSWIVSYVPFIGVPRTMFHYHYIIPLMWACLNAGALIEFAIVNKRVRAFVLCILMILTVVCYQFFSPRIYGTYCPNCASRNWLKAWNDGPPKPLRFFGRQLFNTTEKRIKKMPL